GGRASGRDEDVVVRSDHRDGGFVEEDGLLGRGQAGFPSKVVRVEADADQVSEAGHRGADAVLAQVYRWKVPPSGERRQTAETVGGKETTVVVLEVITHVEGVAFGVDHPRTLLAGRAEPEQLHPQPSSLLVLVADR